MLVLKRERQVVREVEQQEGWIVLLVQLEVDYLVSLLVVEEQGLEQE